MQAIKASDESKVNVRLKIGEARLIFYQENNCFRHWSSFKLEEKIIVCSSEIGDVKQISSDFWLKDWNHSDLI